MIPNIVRGDRMQGLMAYLVGPGRANEHTEPHLVAGDPALLAWHDDAELGADGAARIARHLEHPRKAFDTAVSNGHVWHCSLSLRASEGELSDETWRDIATDFMAAMDFDDPASPKAPCRWVAVNHGLSANGNAHIHLVVNLVRTDGTKANVFRDYKRAQLACRALERKYGLEELESGKDARGTRGYHPAEREAVARSRAKARYERERAESSTQMGDWSTLTPAERQARIAAETHADQPRHHLAMKVRGAAAASANEAEFVRRMRRTGLIVRPRFADGRTDVVTGFSVAERPKYGERPVWYGGGRLARDLTLPRLRTAWEDSPTAASAAAAEWVSAKRGRPVVAPGREALETDVAAWEQCTTEVASLVERLQNVPLTDRDTWALVARQTSGALAAWSNAVEPAPGDLAAAANALSQSAQTYRQMVTPKRAGTVSLSGAAMLLSSVAKGGNGPVAQAAMVRQMLRLTQAVYGASVAAKQARHAELLAHDVRARLVRVREQLPNAVAVSVPPTVAHQSTAANLDPEAQAMLERINASQAASATAAVSPVPDRLTPSPSTHVPTIPDPRQAPEL